MKKGIIVIISQYLYGERRIYWSLPFSESPGINTLCSDRVLSDRLNKYYLRGPFVVIKIFLQKQRVCQKLLNTTKADVGFEISHPSQIS